MNSVNKSSKSTKRREKSKSRAEDDPDQGTVNESNALDDSAAQAQGR